MPSSHQTLKTHFNHRLMQSAFQRYKLTILVVTLILFVWLPPFLSARDNFNSRVEVIRKNPNYIIASGESNSLETARHQAEGALVSQIQVVVGFTSNYSSNAIESDENLKITTEFATRHKSYAGLVLKGLSYLENQDKDNWIVFAFIHRDSIASSYTIQKARIKGLISTGLESIHQGSVGDGLKNLYHAWLLSHFYPDTINLNAYQSDLPTNPQIAADELISTTLSGLNVIAGECYRDDPLLIAPLTLTLDKTNVKDLTFSYYGGHGMEYGRVFNGRADIPLSYEPTSSEQRLLITIEFVYESEIKSDPELFDLYEMFGMGDFPNLKQVVLKFPWIEPTTVVAQVNPSVPSIPTVRKPDIHTPTFSLSEPMQQLYSKQTTSEFLEMLVQYSKLGSLTYGRSGDFGDRKGCFIAVFDDDQIITFLRYDGVQYRSLDDRELYADLAGEFRGKRQVWIKESIK